MHISPWVQHSVLPSAHSQRVWVSAQVSVETHQAVSDGLPSHTPFPTKDSPGSAALLRSLTGEVIQGYARHFNLS